MRPFRLRRPPVRLDAPGDNWPVYPIPSRERAGWISGLFTRLFRRRKPRGERLSR